MLGNSVKIREKNKTVKIKESSLFIENFMLNQPERRINELTQTTDSASMKKRMAQVKGLS